MSGYQSRFCESNLQLTGDFCGDRPEIAIGKCAACGLVQTVTDTHISVQDYASDTHFPPDMTAIRGRELRWNQKRVKLLKQHLPGIESRKILDFGCGTGGFLEQAEQARFNVIGFDVSARVAREHGQRGWKCVSDFAEIDGDVDVVALFHVLEHLPMPWENLAALRKSFPNAKTYVLEVPNTEEALNSVFGNAAYRRNHFCHDHLYYFSEKTFKATIERAGLRIQFFTQTQRYTLANNLGWLANNKGGAQNVWTMFNGDALNDAYEKVLAEHGVGDSLFAICSV
ncbi:MAG: class I SAM-dependent methyltransferase [Bacteriovoracia bacterium]